MLDHSLIESYWPRRKPLFLYVWIWTEDIIYSLGNPLFSGASFKTALKGFSGIAKHFLSATNV